MPPQESGRRDPVRGDRADRRQRARSGVVIIDEDISWQAPSRTPRRLGGSADTDRNVQGRRRAAGAGERAGQTDASLDDALARWIADGPSESEPPATPRTVVITGRVADRYAPVRRSGSESMLRRHHRSGFQPDRVAMWAVMLGILLVVIAATSGHA